jgi:hypothetical protein
MRRPLLVATVVAAVATLAAMLGHPGVAEVMIGALIMCIAVLIGRPLTLSATSETDPRRLIMLDLALVVVVVLALVGVGVMAVAIP